MIELIEAPPRQLQLPEPMPQGDTVTVCRVSTPEGRIPKV